MAKMRRRGVRIPPTTSELEVQATVYDVLHGGAVEVGRKFTKPDDDWWPMWLVATPTQGTMMVPETLRDNVEKGRMTAAVAAFAQKVSATAIGHVHSIWHIPPEKVSDKRRDEIFALANAQDGSTEGVPEREEAVMITVYTATTFRMLLAPITRHDNAPPTLGRFELAHSSDAGDLSGRMTDPLRDALRKYG